MEIKPLIPGLTFTEILVESYLIEDLTSFSELMDVFNKYKTDNSQKTVLITLDNLDQAEYTSTHSIMTNDLDETEGYDLSGLDSACFENNEHIGYLSTPTEFFIRKENFLKRAENIDFSTVCEKGLTIDEDEVLILKNINLSPFKYLDKRIILKIVPVEEPYLGISGFPNGYFASDLDPFENYALARHLFEKYDYELFGIGASLLGFTRKGSLDKKSAKELIADLSKLYNCNESVLDVFLEPIHNSNQLFLKYTDSLEP